jgi:uncharacterized MnhB-related membrane protein
MHQPHLGLPLIAHNNLVDALVSSGSPSLLMACLKCLDGSRF